MFTVPVPDKDKNELLNKAKSARDQRAYERKCEIAAEKIQAFARRYLVRCRLHREARQKIDDLLAIPKDGETDYKPTLLPATEVFATVRKFLLIFQSNKDQERFEYLCKYILLGMNAELIKLQYVSLALNKELVLIWLRQLKLLLWHACSYLKTLKPELSSDTKLITCCLSMLVTFTATNTWRICQSKGGEALRPSLNQVCSNIMGYLHQKDLYPTLQSLLLHGLARSRVAFKSATLTAIITVALRPLIAADFSGNFLSLFNLHILSVPAVIQHMSELAADCLVLLVQHRIFARSLKLFADSQSTKIIFNTLEGNYALCLLANLIQLGFAEKEGLVENTPGFVNLVSSLLQCCQRYVQAKQSNMTHWHPVLGWFAQKSDAGLNEAMPLVIKQLQQLWHLSMLSIIFEPLLSYVSINAASSAAASASDSGASSSNQSQKKGLFKKMTEKAGSSSSRQSNSHSKLNSSLVTSTCRACYMYLTVLQTVTQLKVQVTAGLCCQDQLLPPLVRLLCELGPQCGLQVFLDTVSSRGSSSPAAGAGADNSSIFHLLQLICDMASYTITIVDDIELYEQGRPLSTDTLATLASFLNSFYFSSIWKGLVDISTVHSNDLLTSVHGLLTLLHDRDCRRRFVKPEQWLLHDLKPAAFLAELEKDKRAAKYLFQKVPFIVPLKDRMVLFRKYVQQEKEHLGLTESSSTSPHPTWVAVHRTRIIEDGYRQLVQLPPDKLKGIIRVKFFNELELDEAGIDQDGVFKEFLEEIIKRIFHPSLNLFRVTSEQKLYPSPTSFIQENHLIFFEFVGRLLGKAVYEGIMVDVTFAPFFLSVMLGHHRGSTYSSIDELPSLDADLYKSLTYIKHFDGDVRSLDLMFACDEDVLGQVVSHELIPGGSVIPVTNENKIAYVHLMAHFKMWTQIRQQTEAFLYGFKSIINSDWLHMFTPAELQKLISGDTIDVDIGDLRKHTQYYGGFHNSHRVIVWLWDILENDFTAAERAQFLRFVTSCSKPPLLGFANLEPPFSIRFVEVSEDQDTGDTVGSVLKGFFNIRKKDQISRLPTSSTCFNLLKLPNYQRKSVLREKLRYAINANAGFELS